MLNPSEGQNGWAKTLCLAVAPDHASVTTGSSGNWARRRDAPQVRPHMSTAAARWAAPAHRHTLVEVVDEQGRTVPPATPGHHLLVTSLLNRTLPILRYRLDDLVTLSAEPCPCGRPFPLIVGLDGRSDDVLRLPGRTGAPVALHPLALRSPLARIAGLKQYRIVHEGGFLVIEVVAAEASVPETVAKALRQVLEGQGIEGVAVDVRRVEAIARHAASGKFKLIEAR